MELLDFLLEHYSHLSKNKIKGLLTKGAVRVDGTVRTQYNFPVTEKNQIELVKGEKAVASNAERNMRRFATIVYEDQWLLVIHKKTGVLCVPTGHHGFCLKTLLDEYLQRRGGNRTAHIVHRLDKETSGLMIYAKSREIQDIFTHHWREIIQDRRYYALCNGHSRRETGTIESWLSEDKFYNITSSKKDNGGKYAITHYHLLAYKHPYSLFDVKLETGRKNQIRVHMADIGCPVVGDRKYGNESDPIGRMGLHAYKICFTHPRTGKLLEFSTPIPTSFKTLL